MGVNFLREKAKSFRRLREVAFSRSLSERSLFDSCGLTETFSITGRLQTGTTITVGDLVRIDASTGSITRGRRLLGTVPLSSLSATPDSKQEPMHVGRVDSLDPDFDLLTLEVVALEVPE